MADWVALKGIGPRGSVVIEQDDANVVTLVAGDHQIENITVRLVAPSAPRRLIIDNNNAANLVLEGVDFEVTTPGAFAIDLMRFGGVSTVRVNNCYAEIGGTGGSYTINNNNAATAIHLTNNDFTFNNINAFHIRQIIAGSVITGGENRWAGTCAMFDCANGNITLDNDVVVCPVINVVTAGTAIVLLRKSLSTFEVLEGMSVQDALDALPADGGKLICREGVFTADAAQIARAIDNVTIIGQGLNTRLELDGVTPVISAGTQDGWILADFDVDAGLVEIQFATNSTLHNITINGLHGTIINPDLGQTNFPGQPVMRLEEIRPLDPAATEIIKQYGRL